MGEMARVSASILGPQEIVIGGFLGGTGLPWLTTTLKIQYGGDGALFEFAGVEGTSWAALPPNINLLWEGW